MIFLHIFDDYILQSFCLGSLKQRDWWKQNAPKKMYKYDYLVALFMHSFSWSFMIMIPTFFYNNFNIYVFIGNLLIHFITDHLKANMRKINLVVDQSIHILQIVMTYLICFVWL